MVVIPGSMVMQMEFLNKKEGGQELNVLAQVINLS